MDSQAPRFSQPLPRITAGAERRPYLEDLMDIPVSLTVNGKAVSATLEPRTLLVQLLREHLRLTGTHVGCDTGQCGACTVHVNGRAVKSCNVLAAQVEGANVVTIEGIAADGELHPMQTAFRDHHGLQCGFCTPGIVMNAIDLVKQHPNPSEETVRAGLEGNFCRCTGYHNIVKAVLAGAAAMRR
jgi:carbon-monoxide dehydrogenase small subunit